MIADYDAHSAVERELVLRLARLLWRLRLATTMEDGLFEIQAAHSLEFRRKRHGQQSLIRAFFFLQPTSTKKWSQTWVKIGNRHLGAKCGCLFPRGSRNAFSCG